MSTTAAPIHPSVILSAIDAAYDQVSDLVENYGWHTYMSGSEPTIPVVTNLGVSVAIEVEGDPDGQLVTFVALDAMSGEVLARGHLSSFGDITFA